MTEAMFKYLDDESGEWYYKSIMVNSSNLLLANQKVKEYCKENKIKVYKIGGYRCEIYSK